MQEKKKEVEKKKRKTKELKFLNSGKSLLHTLTIRSSLSDGSRRCFLISNPIKEPRLVAIARSRILDSS